MVRFGLSVTLVRFLLGLWDWVGIVLELSWDCFGIGSFLFFPFSLQVVLFRFGLAWCTSRRLATGISEKPLVPSAPGTRLAAFSSHLGSRRKSAREMRENSPPSARHGAWDTTRTDEPLRRSSGFSAWLSLKEPPSLSLRSALAGLGPVGFRIPSSPQPRGGFSLRVLSTPTPLAVGELLCGCRWHRQPG
jgi:hypothetical protein